MTCGIYKLTFPSGNFYIGKSVDIEKRWKQHWDAFQKGTHTKNMQREYNTWDTYIQEVIFECHEDHIDIIEESFIATMCPTLNGTKGRDRLSRIASHAELFVPYFNMSTLEHIVELHNGKNTISTMQEELEEAADAAKELNKTIDSLKRIRSNQELEADTTGRIQGLEHALKETRSNCAELSAECEKLDKECMELWKYKQLPWYKKLFN